MTSESSKQKQQQQRLMLQQKQQQLSLNIRQAIPDNIRRVHSPASAPFAVGMKDLLHNSVIPAASQCKHCKIFLNADILAIHKEQCIHQEIKCLYCDDAFKLMDADHHTCKWTKVKAKHAKKNAKSEVSPEASVTSSERKHGYKTPEHTELQSIGFKSSEKFKTVEYPSYLEGHSVVVPDSTWTLAGELSIKRISTKEQEITWNISRFLNIFWREGKKIVSPKFSFADVTWHFCFSMDSKKNHSLFAIDVQTHSSSDPECDCYCSISFLDVLFTEVKNIKYDFKCESAHWTVTNFLSSSEIDNFEGSGANIVCRISIKNSSIKEACSETKISYLTHSAVEAHTQTQLPENAELPMPGFDYKVLQDFKNLLLNGEGSDVTLQVEDQQFKAHWSFLTARSSVFAAMFKHDMKEKDTGIVNVKDCELSSFPVFLEYLYCGSTENISSENVFNLYVSADKYDIQDLKRKCLEFMKSNLSVNSFCETLQITLQNSERDLLKLATEFFIRNLQDIILTTKWQTFIVENPIQGNELFIKAAKTFR